MPLIAPQLKPARHPLSVKIDTRLLTLLKAYTAFISSGLEYVLNEALLVTFVTDRDFQTWLAADRPEDLHLLKALMAEHRLPGGGRRRPSAPPPSRGRTSSTTDAAAVSATSGQE